MVGNRWASLRLLCNTSPLLAHQTSVRRNRIYGEVCSATLCQYDGRIRQRLVRRSLVALRDRRTLSASPSLLPSRSNGNSAARRRGCRLYLYLAERPRSIRRGVSRVESVSSFIDILRHPE